MAADHVMTKNEFDKLIKSNISNIDGKHKYVEFVQKIDQIIGMSYDYDKLKNHKFMYASESTMMSAQTDYKKIMIDETTNIITKQIFQPYGFEKFVHFVYKNFKAMINDYIDNNKLTSDSIVILLKGGNINRKIVSKFINACDKSDKFNKSLMKKLNKYTNKIYERSDADFCIYVNKKMYSDSMYEKIIEDIKSKTFNLLRLLRNDIYRLKRSFFDSYNFNNLTSILINKLNNNSELKKIAYENKHVPIHVDSIIFAGKENGEHLLHPTVKKDMIITFESTKEPIFISDEYTMKSAFLKTKYVEGYGDKIFYASMNDNVSYISTTPTNEQYSTVFSLMRMKMLFKIKGSNIPANSGPKPVLREDVLIGGELIDVSVPNILYAGEKKDLEHFFDHQFKNIDTYEMTSLYGIGHVSGISNFYLINDLHKILFIRDYPWNDNKYIKRLKRFFISIVIEMITEIENLAYYLLLVDHIHNILQSYIDKKIYDKIFMEKPKLGSIVVTDISNILNDIPKMIILAKNNDPNITQFIQNCLEGLDLIINILKQFINNLTYDPMTFYNGIHGIQLGGCKKFRFKMLL